MRTARRLGVSVKRLDGWTPTTRTVVTAWTPGGQPAAWETTTDPEWDDRERSLMLAMDLYEQLLCRDCQHLLTETTDPDTDPDRRIGRRWVADLPTECYACKSLHQSQAKFSESDSETERRMSRWLIHTTALVDPSPGTVRPPSY